jgi:hypothetical protein
MGADNTWMTGYDGMMNVNGCDVGFSPACTYRAKRQEHIVRSVSNGPTAFKLPKALTCMKARS